MINYIRITLLVLVSICIYSCDCVNVDCEPDKEFFSVNLVSLSDSTNLIFGDEAIYDVEDVSLFTIVDGRETPGNLFILNFSNNLTSALGIPCFNLENETFFLDLGNGDIDTLGVSFEKVETECCGDILRMNTAEFNGREVSVPVDPYEPILLGK